MYVNVYALSKIAEARVAELREARARIALLESVRDPRRGAAARLGAALIRAGQWLTAGEPSAGGSVPGPRCGQQWRRSAPAS